MTSFLGELHAGRLRWDLLHPFPRQPAADQAAGAAACAELSALLADRADPDWIDAERKLPPGLVAALAEQGFLRLTGQPSHAGGLSPLSVYRVLEAAARHHTAVGIFLAWHCVLGIAAYRRLLAPGQLSGLVDEALADGLVFGLADSEPTGAANAYRGTVAEPTEDGQGYLLTGEKVFVGNGSEADLLTVTATVRDRDGERIDLFLVDTAAEGFSVVGVQELTGLVGSPIAALRLNRVYVPAQRMLATAAGGWRDSPAVQRLNALARMTITVSQTLGPARESLRFARDFLGRRPDMNGRPLAGYDAVRRRLAAAAAEVYALDSVVQWCLLGDPAAAGDVAGGGGDRLPELTAAKNIGTLGSWRVVDEVVSLLGGEGVETAASKQRRGAPSLPVERALRDVRCLRVAGGVDFNVDLRAGWAGIFAPLYRAGQPAAGGGVAGGGVASEPAPLGLRGSLSAANLRHLEFVAEQVPAVWSRCAGLAARHPAAELAERQELLIATNQITNELFTMAVVLARSAGLADPGAQRLAEVYCAVARDRVTASWPVLAAGGLTADADHAAVSDGWLAGELDDLLG